MIFVTVGNHYQEFNRLIRKMDEIAGRTDEKVVMQLGYTKYKPIHAESFDFTDYVRIKKLNQEARVVVSHAGVGSIITALELGVPVIIVPRLKKFGEHINDHQLEIAEAMSDNDRVRVIYDIEDVEKSLNLKFSGGNIPMTNKLSESIKNYLKSTA